MLNDDSDRMVVWRYDITISSIGTLSNSIIYNYNYNSNYNQSKVLENSNQC